MEAPQREKRYVHDLRDTFDVVVGKAPSPVERFTVYTDVLTRRSRFLCAARKSEWLGEDRTKPVDLSDEEPDIFQTYLNCVYFGADTLRVHTDRFECHMADFNDTLYVGGLNPNTDESSITRLFEAFGNIENVTKSTISKTSYRITFTTATSAAQACTYRNGYQLNGRVLQVRLAAMCADHAREARGSLADPGHESLIKLYLLADKLQDLATANMVMDELVRYFRTTQEIPKHAATQLAYQFTTDASPLRRLVWSLWVHQTIPHDKVDLLLENDYPKDFFRDSMVGSLRNKIDVAEGIKDDDPTKCSYKCTYHQHDDEHPECGM